MTTDTKRRLAPTHLQQKTREWWCLVVREFELNQSQIKLLTLAGEAWDISRKCRETLDKSGVTYLDRFEQPRERPEVDIYKDQTAAFARLMKQLQFDLPMPEGEA